MGVNLSRVNRSIVLGRLYRPLCNVERPQSHSQSNASKGRGIAYCRWHETGVRPERTFIALNEGVRYPTLFGRGHRTTD